LPLFITHSVQDFKAGISISSDSVLY